jgi:hypothetical protein
VRFPAEYTCNNNSQQETYVFQYSHHGPKQTQRIFTVNCSQEQTYSDRKHELGTSHGDSYSHRHCLCQPVTAETKCRQLEAEFLSRCFSCGFVQYRIFFSLPFLCSIFPSKQRRIAHTAVQRTHFTTIKLTEGSTAIPLHN